MRIIRGFQSSPPEAPSSVVALGAFDGIHLAHQKILDVAVSRARTVGAQALVCTFDPYPLQVLRPEQAPPPISTLDERLALIARHGIDTTVVIPFTREFSQVEPEAFVKDVLLDRLHAREIVVGFNHTFGRGARGDARLLESLAARLGFVAHVIPALTVGGVTVSSSAIREALRAGDVATARRFLGRPYTIRGTVARGAGRGRQLGFPTANIKPDRPLTLATGVYAGYALVGDEAALMAEPGVDRGPGEKVRSGASAGTGAAQAGVVASYKTVVNIGYRPTFGENEYWIEAYIIDFTGDIYDQPIAIALTGRIREERKFSDVEALRHQISADVAAAAAML